MTREFLTLPDELQAIANELMSDLRRRGYACKPEVAELQLPSSPTLVASRGHEQHYFLVRTALDNSEVQQWVRYACSCSGDTRITVCSLSLSATHENAARLLGVGLVTSRNAKIDEIVAARDLAFHAQAPDRASLKPKVRSLLGEALDRLEKGDWRPAFEDACGILEEECRKYLLKNQKLNRVRYRSGGNTKVPTAKQIKKMPMGMLKDVFCNMLSQNQLESNLCAALEKLNPDRIRRVHKRLSRQTELALRRRVGTHFWLINNALALLVR